MDIRDIDAYAQEHGCNWQTAIQLMVAGKARSGKRFKTIPIECVTCYCMDDSREDCLCDCHPWSRE
jgi:hypothetical protein